MYNQRKNVSHFWALCVAAILVFPPMGNPAAAAARNIFQCWLLLLLARATLSFYSLSLWLRPTSFIFRFMFVQDNNNNNKKRTISSLHFSHTEREWEREKRRALIDFGASFVVCARRSLCSFSSARHIFLFPLCATLLPLRCLPACLVVYVCECEWICVCMYVLYRHVYIFIFHIFGLFLPCTHTHTHTHTETDTRTPTLLCRFYNLSLLCVCVCVWVCAHAMFNMFAAMLPNFTHTDASALSYARNAYTASEQNFLSCSLKVSFVYILRTCAE